MRVNPTCQLSERTSLDEDTWLLCIGRWLLWCESESDRESVECESGNLIGAQCVVNFSPYSDKKTKYEISITLATKGATFMSLIF